MTTWFLFISIQVNGVPAPCIACPQQRTPNASDRNMYTLSELVMDGKNTFVEQLCLCVCADVLLRICRE
jgi:hypothetical protein